ncbi:cuticle protein-like [Cloeon dipterum]|uniref:cuticle protein-like n=1 Tax=Cloeon dipterum TaxID=197152 RepID=UPI00321FB796
MRFLIVAALASVAVAAPQNYFYSAPIGWPYGFAARTIAAPVVSAPIVAPIALSHSKYHAQDVLGQASFGHVEALQTRAEARDALGNVRGSYSYVDPNGKVNVVEYTAGHGGFRILGANNLPEAPVAPEAPAVPALIAPEPVQDTAEVVAARAEFARLYKEAAEAAAADKVPEVPEVPAAAVEEPAAAVEVSRRRRSVLLAGAPVLAKSTVKVQSYEPIDAAVPAATRKIELVEKEHDVLSHVGYAAPVAYTAPIAYSAPIAYHAPLAFTTVAAAAPAAPAEEAKPVVEAKSAEVKADATPLVYSYGYHGFAGFPFYHL